jgi:hypothetical protein
LLLEAKQQRQYVWAGICFSLGFLFKVPAGFDFGAAFIWLIFFGGLKFKTDHSAFRKLGLFVVGFLTPILITFVYYFAVGAGKDYLVAAYLQNFGYLSSWQTGSISRSGTTSGSGLLIRGVILLVVTGFSWIMTRKETPIRRLLPIWFAWALYGALLSERPYPHYLVQVLPAGSLLLPTLFNRQKKIYLLLTVILTSLTVGAVLKYRFYFYPTISYYQNFVSYVTRQKSVEAYRNSFDPRVNRNYHIAQYLKLRSTPDDRIFIWGDEPFIYALADRLPAGKYTVAYHIIDFNGQQITMDALRSKPPLYIVLETSEKRDFKELIAFTLANYVPVAQIEDATIFHRL